MPKKIILFGILGVAVIGIGVYLLSSFNSKDADDNNQTQSQLTTDSENESDEFVPTKPFPEGLPIYPGAILTSEISSPGSNWQWLFQTTGSGNDIRTFFINSLTELGFAIDNEASIAKYEEFFVITEDGTISVYWLDSDSISDIDNITPDTPNRHYAISVDLEKWENR
jgi:hypothetical protein